MLDSELKEYFNFCVQLFVLLNFNSFMFLAPRFPCLTGKESFALGFTQQLHLFCGYVLKLVLYFPQQQ